MRILGTLTLMGFCVTISIGDNLVFTGSQDSSLHRNGRALATESAGLGFGNEFEPNLNLSLSNNLGKLSEEIFNFSSVPDHPNIEGEIPCPSDPQKVCRISESLCSNTTCPEHPGAECTVIPCTCEAVFEDSAGQVVNCLKSQDNSVVYDGRASDVLVSEGNDTNGHISEGTGNDLQTSSGNDTSTPTSEGSKNNVSVSDGVDTDVPVSEVGSTDKPVSDDRNSNNSVTEDSTDAPVSKGSDTVTENPDSTVTDVPEMATITPTDTTVPPTEPPYIEPLSRTAAMWILIVLCVFLITVVAVIGYKRWKRCHGPYLYIPARRPNVQRRRRSSDRERESFTESYTNKPDEGSGV